MESKIEELEKRLSALENPVTKKEKEPKQQNDYQRHMSLRLKELKEESESKGVDFDRKQAFGQAAREWTANKKQKC